MPSSLECFRSSAVRALGVVGHCILCSSCVSGTETGNPSFKGQFSYAGHSSSADLAVSTASNSAPVTVERAWLSLDLVRLTLDGACNPAAHADIEVPALGVGDHAAGDHNYTDFDGTLGNVCVVQLPFVDVADPSSLGSAPLELLDHAILLEGRLADGAPFRILSRAEPVVELVVPGDGFELSEENSALLVAFDFAVWLEGVDLSAAERVDDAIEISETHNVGLLGIFEANLTRGVELYGDGDGDGRIDAGSEPVARGN